MRISEIINTAVAARASDIHLICSLPPKYRVDGQVTDASDPAVKGTPDAPLTHEDCEAIARELAGDRFEDLERVGELDMGKTFEPDTRTRINIFRQQEHYSIVLRILRNTIPKLSDLGLPDIISAFPKYERGIVIVTGETGSGKSTTLAAILNEINTTRSQHIVTLEDPIEYIYKPARCIINQREIGRDTSSYASGLRAVLREDPDVILIGEMRDLETIETALVAAETGHLVFATLHTNSAADAIDRIVDVFPEGQQQQIRMQLSMTLIASLSQQLLPRYMKKGRVVACEVMICTPAIRNLIRERKTPQIRNTMASSASYGNITMDNALIRLFRERAISQQTVLSAAYDADYVAKQLGTVPGTVAGEIKRNI